MAESTRDDIELPAGRIGVVAGLVAMMCCVGPTVLAVLGVMTGAAAVDLANGLYGEYAWHFRASGLLVGAALVYVSLKRRNACSIDGVRSAKLKLLGGLFVAVTTYAVLYAVTTLLGTLA